MPDTEVLILAMTRMLSGVCTAGMTRQPDETTGLRWVRPVKDFGTLLLGDLTARYGADSRWILTPANTKPAWPSPWATRHSSDR